MSSFSKKIKVLVVDDSAFYRQSLINLLEKSPNIEIMGIAKDGLEAIRFLTTNQPDLITLDLEMPKLDGITFFRWLMKNNPIPSIIISSIEGGRDTLKVMDMGAVDFIAKPTKLASMEFMSIENELFEKVAAIASISKDKLLARSKLTGGYDTGSESDDKVLGTKRIRKNHEEGVDKIVVIGSSTGGPSAVQKVLAEMPQDFPYPILISQHMPEGFTKPFADRLDRISKISVEEARTGLQISSGKAFVCPGSNHMELYKNNGGDIFITLSKAREVDPYSPSVDVMMQSAVEIYKENSIGLILTGMGHDGCEGMRLIKKFGGNTIVESEETALIYGMPRVVVENNLADLILPLQLIGGQVLRYAGY